MTQIDLHITQKGESRNKIGSKANKDQIYTVGFGSAYICKECGESVFDFEVDLITLKDAENQIHFEHNTKYFLEVSAPLWSVTWERDSDGEWICVKSGDGFA